MRVAWSVNDFKLGVKKGRKPCNRKFVPVVVVIVAAAIVVGGIARVLEAQRKRVHWKWKRRLSESVC